MRNGLILLTLVLLTLPTEAAMVTTAAGTTTYWKVNINLVGSGTLTVMLFDPTTQKITNQSVITQSTSFLIPNNTGIILKSNQSFVVNNQGMITKEYAQPITSNTTLTVNFDVQNVKLPLIEAKIVLLNNGSLIVLVGNLRTRTLYTNMTINQTTTLEVPPNSTVILFSDVPFRIANFSVPGYFMYFYFNVTKPIIVAIIFASTSTTTSTSTSTTTTSSTISSIVPPPTTSSSTQNNTVITLPAHTGTPTLITSTTSSPSSTTIYIIIIAVLIIAILVYFLLRTRK